MTALALLAANLCLNPFPAIIFPPGLRSLQIKPVVVASVPLALLTAPSFGTVIRPYPLLPIDQINDKKASIIVSDWELSNVLQSLARQTGVNISLVSKDNPKVTLNLQKAPLQDILRMIAIETKLKFLRVGDGFAVAAEETLRAAYPSEYAAQYPVIIVAESEEAIDYYTCNSIQPSQAAQTLISLFGPSKGDAKAKPAHPFQAIVAPSQLLPVASSGTSGSGRSQGGSGGQGSATSSVGAGGQGQSGASSNSYSGNSSGTGNEGRIIILRGDPATVAAAIKVLKNIDKARPQVMVQVQIADVSTDALKDLGITWTYSNLVLTERPTTDFKPQKFDRNPLSFTGVMAMLESKNKARTLARPNIVVRDQQSGYILVGSRINYPVVTSLNSQGQPIYDIKEERVGIYMQVTANIDDSGYVTLNVLPQVSTISGFLSVNGASYPQISTRESGSTLRIKDGETRIMGGLVNEEDIVSWQKVPILGDIPFFGELFTKRKTTKTKSEVIVSITPTIIKE